MPFIPIPDGVKVCMRFNNCDQLACNVFHVKVTEEITEAVLNAIGAIFKNWWVTSMKPNVPPDISLEAVEVTDASVSGGLGVEYTTGLPVTGSNSNPPMPQNVTAAVKLTTGHTGRSYRGRSYVVGLPNSFRDNKGHLTSAAQTAIDTAYEALIDALQAATWDLAIASLYSGGAPRAAGILTPVIAASVNLALDSQRRRLPERGA